MNIQSINSTTFGKVYYGTKTENLTATQRDVLSDINDVMAENDIVKRLEKLKFDIYIEPRKNNNLALDVALFKNVRFDEKNNMSYKKVVILGGFAEITNRYKYAMGDSSGVLSADLFLSKIERFFKGYERNIFRRYVNYV